MRALSLDPATTTGYAFGIFGKKPRSGLIRLPSGKSASPESRFCHLEGRVRDLITGCKAEMVIIEDIYAMPNQRFSMDNMRLLAGYRAAIGMAVHKCGLDTAKWMKLIMPDSWRKTFGTNDVPPIVRQQFNAGKKDAIRKWKKEAAFKRCLELGWEPETHDEADALGIWAYGESLFCPDFGVERTPLFASAAL